MDSKFENEFGQEEERVRGRSRRRGAVAASAASIGAEIGSGAGSAGRESRRQRSAAVRAAGYGSAAHRTAAVQETAAGGDGAKSHRFVPAYERASETKGSGYRDSAMRRGKSGRPGKEPADPAKEKVKRLRRRIIAMIVAECFLICAFLGVRYVKQKASLLNIDTTWNAEEMTNSNISVAKEEMMKGYWTVALFGVDSRNNSVGQGNMADVIIICNVNQETGEIKLVSVFRDTYLSIDDNGNYNKINQAYFRGGPRQAVEALNRNLDLEIDDYATFNWKAVADAINILGGVDVELSKAEFYYINAYITETVEATGVASVHLKQAGLNHLDGVQAVAYARLRKMDTDFARTERQRLIIQLCFDKMKQSNFSVVNNIMEVVFPQIMTSVRFDDLIPLARNVANYTIGDTMGFPAARGDANMGNKGDCVIPQTLESNVKDLHSFLFDDADYEPSDMVKKISAKISADSDMYKEAKPIESRIPPMRPRAVRESRTRVYSIMKMSGIWRLLRQTKTGISLIRRRTLIMASGVRGIFGMICQRRAADQGRRHQVQTGREAADPRERTKIMYIGREARMVPARQKVPEVRTARMFQTDPGRRNPAEWAVS